MDIFPDERRVEIRGTYRLDNKTAAPIDTLHVTSTRTCTSTHRIPDAHTTWSSDDEFGYHIFALDEPLAPGETIDLAFDLTVSHRGFVNHEPDTADRPQRHLLRQRPLLPGARLRRGPAAGRPQQAAKTTLSRPAREWPTWTTSPPAETTTSPATRTGSTSRPWSAPAPTRSPIAPGYLQREWEEDGRRYFHYKMDAPILNFYSFLSADYDGGRDRWNDVAIEVYHHEPHDYNVDRMIRRGQEVAGLLHRATSAPTSTARSASSSSPTTRSFAQSFPNTIPFSEAIGFIARIDDEEDIDYVFNITAHEVAHQWWAHQVIGGDVQGATLMSESLAEYSALMVMEKEYGPEKMRRFLRYELDGYLTGRGERGSEELPLMLVENQTLHPLQQGQPGHVRPAGLHRRGALNRALARYRARIRLPGTALHQLAEFLACIREECHPILAYVLEDMFETITLFSNRVGERDLTALDDGTLPGRRWRWRRGSCGRTGRAPRPRSPIDDWIDIGVFGEPAVDGDDRRAFMEKRHITEPRHDIERGRRRPPAAGGHRSLQQAHRPRLRRQREEGRREQERVLTREEAC